MKHFSLTVEGAQDLAEAAGFASYEDFCRWRDEHPDEYEAWYRSITRRADGDDA